MKIALFALMLASCTDLKPRPASATTTTMNAPVTARLVSLKPGRPPVGRLFLDVQLRNDDPVPRWFVLPLRLPLAAGGFSAWAAAMPSGSTPARASLCTSSRSIGGTTRTTSRSRSR